MLSSDSDRRLMANAVGGISARACDSCVKKRARWYCAADDAFLCQCCDASVHSANSLARRHQRVRLKSISLNSHDDSVPAACKISAQSWHQGFTRKARTPRHKKIARLCSEDEPVVSGSSNPSPIVPEISGERCACWENDEHDLVLHRVPVFDSQIDTEIGGEFGHASDSDEFSLSEFAADFESLLGKGIEGAAWFDMDGLETERAVKIEDASLPTDVEFTHLNLGYDDGEEDTKKDAEDDHVYQKKIFLSLDYDGVMSAWDGQKSPWTTGERPDLNSSGGCWPYCLGMCGTIHVMDGDRAGVMSGSTVDGGRMARVMRYREKRRTRLFSKKIRYQVRKLNAEKRPRIKGRFVKTPNFVVLKS